MALHWSQNYQVIRQNEFEMPLRDNQEFQQIQQIQSFEPFQQIQQYHSIQKLTRPRDAWVDSLRQHTQSYRSKFTETQKMRKKRFNVNQQNVNLPKPNLPRVNQPKANQPKQNPDELVTRHLKLTQLRNRLGRSQKQYNDVRQKHKIVQKTVENVVPRQESPIVLDKDLYSFKRLSAGDIVTHKNPQRIRKHIRGHKSQRVNSLSTSQILNKHFQNKIIQYLRLRSKQARECPKDNSALECIHEKPTLDNLPVTTHRSMFNQHRNLQDTYARNPPTHLRKTKVNRTPNRPLSLQSISTPTEEYDVEVIVDSISFNCRSSVLTRFSEYFAKELAEPKLTVFLPEGSVRPGVFATIYNWMLSTQPLLQHVDIWELLRATNFLRIRQLVDQCISRLEILGNRVYLKACARQLHKSEEYLLKRICEAYYNLESMQQPANFSIEELEQFLKNRKDGSEILKLMVSARWLNHKWSDRKIYIPLLMHTLNFTRMPPWFLTTLRKNLHCPQLKNVMRQKELWLQLNDAMFHKSEMYLKPPRSIRSEPGSGMLGNFFAKSKVGLNK
ncbi:uncharacterized protein LOC119662510 [Teleopsis dalmanni]|uniref:uncharacterized protein LOC119662490 n=1 Tax=Teleopsis dalmanni TaxID=139649 RepID=UPI0018CFE75E|nr:uncharacterized protein LOC119662490 [Teleopsis dalmanni]XP_037928071.1 uncharacterized protein LOC119662510 [Teleopsis dalmanni]